MSEKSGIETIIQTLLYLGARSWGGVNVKGERVGEGVNDQTQLRPARQQRMLRSASFSMLTPGIWVTERDAQRQSENKWECEPLKGRI